jgi:hypothetical protein
MADVEGLLWLAAENEFLRRTLRNDRETIAHLRAQLHTAKRALRTLHAQGACAERSPVGEQQHRCLLAQLSNLDRLALDWSRRCEAIDDEVRELCKLRVDHAQVLEASQALRTVHEAAIHSLEAELETTRVRCDQAERGAASLRASKEHLALQVEALSGRADITKEEAGIAENETQMSLAVLERQVQILENMLTSSGGDVSSRHRLLLGEVQTAKAKYDREAEARKQREVQVKHLMKLVRHLEERNASTLQKLEKLEEEFSGLQQAAVDAARHLQEKDQVIEGLDRQCEAYETALKSKKKELGARQQAPLAVSRLTNRDHLLARPPSRDAKHNAKPVNSAPPPGASSRRPQPTNCKKGTECATASINSARAGESCVEPSRRRPLACLKEAATRPTAVRARTASRASNEVLFDRKNLAGADGGNVEGCIATRSHAKCPPREGERHEHCRAGLGCGETRRKGGETEASDKTAGSDEPTTSASSDAADSICQSKLREILSELQRDEGQAISTADLLSAILAA